MAPPAAARPASPTPDEFTDIVNPPAVPAASHNTVRMRRLTAGRSQAPGGRALIKAYREAGSSDDDSDSDDGDDVVYCGCLSAQMIVAAVFFVLSCLIWGVAMYFGMVRKPDLSSMLSLHAWMVRRLRAPGAASQPPPPRVRITREYCVTHSVEAAAVPLHPGPDARRKPPSLLAGMADQAAGTGGLPRVRHGRRWRAVAGGYCSDCLQDAGRAAVVAAGFGVGDKGGHQR